MSSNWPLHSLSDFINVKHGFAFKGEFFKVEHTTDLLVTPGNFAIGGGFKSDKFKFYKGPVPEDYVLSEGELIVTMTDLSKQADTLGYSALVPKIGKCRLLHNQRVGLVEFKNDELDKTYLYFLLRSKEYRHHVVSTATGSTVKHSSPTKILSFAFRKPPKDIQIDIGKKLIALEEKIENNTQTNQTLEQIAQALFKSWFVDFDPVKAKMNGELPEGMDDATASLFPEKLVESELGLIPEGWQVGSLSSIVDVIMGQSPKGTTYNDQGEGTPLVNGPVEFGVYHPVDQKWTTAPTKLSKDKDLIVCVRGSTTGRYVVSDGEYCLGRGVCSIRSDDSPAFANYLFKSQLNNLLNLTTGSTFPSWSGPTLKNFKVVVPPQNIIGKFESIVGNLCSMMAQNTGENESLSQLRDTLLPKLLSGEINLTSEVVA
ncbi:restriction endonuclease subunit S [Vibrio campbellii]|uniref:restriction endonuclease subunit S n=1 Tax=Vibrio campbellii TaxID=680 RepID=UPI0038CD67FB